MKITLNYPKSAAMGFLFQGTQELVRNSRGKRAISVRAIEVLLYLVITKICQLWQLGKKHLTISLTIFDFQYRIEI